MADKKQTREKIFLGVLVVIALIVWFVYARPNAAVNDSSSASGAYTPINAQDYGPILRGVSKAQGTEYKSAGRNIFVMGAMPKEAAKLGPPRKVFVVYNQPQLPAPPPPAQLPMVFFGYGMLPAGGARQAFLKEEPGETIYIVSEGDVVLNHIRILHIGNDRIDFEDTATGQRGSKNLEAAPAA